MQQESRNSLGKGKKYNIVRTSCSDCNVAASDFNWLKQNIPSVIQKGGRESSLFCVYPAKLKQLCVHNIRKRHGFFLFLISPAPCQTQEIDYFSCVVGEGGYLEGMKLLLLWGEELLVHLYTVVCTICKGSIICLHWYVRSILRFPLNYSEPRELSYTICISLHNAQHSSPRFVLFSCKIEASSEVACEFLGSFCSWSLHTDSRERYQRTGGQKWGIGGSLWDSCLLTSQSQTFS